MVDTELVFDSVRRGYNDLSVSSNDDIAAYFDDVDPDAMIGHVNNIKGILFEQLYVDQLAEQGIHAEIFEAINHPVVDITVFDEADSVEELQLKATDSVAYINDTLGEHPDLSVVVTSEVAGNMNTDMVIDSGIDNAVVENAVIETLVDDTINPLSPLSVFGWFIGLPF